MNRLFNTADLVFVDAPCSGSGAMRRSPDCRWRPFNPEVMAQIQLNLMEQSARLVRPGGGLIYVTCSFERSQNEAIIDALLLTEVGKEFMVVHGQASLDSAIEYARRDTLMNRTWTPEPTGGLFTGPYLRTWPHRTNMDAFFGARLIKRSQ